MKDNTQEINLKQCTKLWYQLKKWMTSKINKCVQ
jgi:hypothetical protein